MSVKAVEKGLKALLLFAGDETELSVTEVAERLGITKGQASKTLRSFRESGLLVQDPRTRRYSVGIISFILGSRFINSHQMTRDAVPLLWRLVEQTGFGARLCLTFGNRVVYLHGIEGPLLPTTGWRVGTWMPIHATAAGKSIAAFFDEERMEAALAEERLHVFTPRTITDTRVLKKDLAQVRKRGFATNRGELTVGLGVVAVPVFDRERNPVGALSVVFPEHYVEAGQEAEIAAALHEAASTLSARTGCEVYPFGWKPPLLGRNAERGATAPGPSRARVARNER